SFAFFFFHAEDGIRDFHVTGVQTCALPIYGAAGRVLVGVANAAHEPAHGLEDGVVTGPRRVGARLPETRERAIHQARVLGRQREIGRASCRERVWLSVAAVS